MQIHIPDPAYTRSDAARANFRLAVKIAAAFVALLWFIQLLNWGVAPGLEEFGIRPREWAGLPGILFAPLLHGGFQHLLANSVPLLVLGTAMLFLYPHAVGKALPAIWLGTGVAVWLFAGSGIHIGASGLVYGLAAYVFVAGVIRRDRRAIASALVVAFLYGTLVWGVTPIERGVSWETHLAAAVIGVAMAIATRHVDVPPRLRYAWEDEPEPEAAPEAGQDVEIGEYEWRVVEPPSRTLH
jgi:membrane associated rhomboid family serine protease